ncbi:MAG: hypothetical protein WD988_00625 [Candidatus Curtissbacteria bacterium]
MTFNINKLSLKLCLKRSYLLKNTKIFSSFLVVLILALIPVISMFIAVPKAYAATSPSLGAAASFAVLAGSLISNVPTSVITGDVGLSPASGSSITGLTAAEVSVKYMPWMALVPQVPSMTQVYSL